MDHSNRDLLILFNQELMTPSALEEEVEKLHRMLYATERMDSLVVAHEIINLNRYRIIRKPFELRKFFRQRTVKPFVFLNCLN
jgi:hypothetical protein